MKILKGLNSNTCNYLEENKKLLKAHKGAQVMSVDPTKNQSLKTTQFFSQCVRINKPCKMVGMAKNWPAYEQWNSLEMPW